LLLKGRRFAGTKTTKYIDNRLLVGEPLWDSNKYIADAIYKQLTTLEMYFFGGLHEPAVLAEINEDFT
jgi:hypothetical protein